MTYHLLEHENPNAPLRENGKRGWYYPSRLKRINLLVVHTAENLPDITPPDDTGAESVARYGTQNTRPASWHTVVDSDSIIPCLPMSYTAFHVRNYNSRSGGLEIATRAAFWSEAPGWWKNKILDNAAKVVAEWVKTFGIPVRFVTKAQVDAGSWGITSHAQLDPTRRSDPGAMFPWEDFLSRVREGGTTVTHPYADRDSWSDWGAESIQKAIDQGVMVGHTTADGRKLFKPTEGVTREQLAKVLDNLGLLDKET